MAEGVGSFAERNPITYEPYPALLRPETDAVSFFNAKRWFC